MGKVLELLATVGLVVFVAVGAVSISTPNQACTGTQAREGVNVVRTGAPLAGPASGIVTIAADTLDAAIEEYLAQHPEKLDQKLSLEDWLAIAGIGIFGGGVRRGLTSVGSKLTSKKGGGAAAPTSP